MMLILLETVCHFQNSRMLRFPTPKGKTLKKKIKESKGKQNQVLQNWRSAEKCIDLLEECSTKKQNGSQAQYKEY